MWLMIIHDIPDYRDTFRKRTNLLKDLASQKVPSDESDDCSVVLGIAEELLRYAPHCFMLRSPVRAVFRLILLLQLS